MPTDKVRAFEAYEGRRAALLDRRHYLELAEAEMTGIDGSRYWRGVFPRAEVEIVSGSRDVTSLRGTGSFDWTMEDVFLPERRTVPQIGIPVENQWSRWPGLTYQLPM
jgi:hypothetical protein